MTDLKAIYKICLIESDLMFNMLPVKGYIHCSESNTYQSLHFHTQQSCG